MTGADGDLGGDGTASLACAGAWFGCCWPSDDFAEDAGCVPAETGGSVALGWRLACALAEPLKACSRVPAVGEASSMLLVSLSAASWSSVATVPSVKESSSTSCLAGRLSSSPSSSMRRRWPSKFLRRGAGAMAAKSLQQLEESRRERRRRSRGRGARNGHAVRWLRLWGADE